MTQQVSAGNVSGTLARIRFHSEESSFLIGILDDKTTVKGPMLNPQIGMEYILEGRWVEHVKYGKQFEFTSYRTETPTSNSAIRSYLRENCKWIGPQISRALLEMYGDEALAICKADPFRVAKQIKGITISRATQIKDMLVTNEKNEKAELELKEIIGAAPVSKRAITQILKIWGDEAPGIVQRNPYELIERITGIGFIIADQIARNIGFDLRGFPRIQAGIIHVLRDSTGHGHCCLPYDQAIDNGGKLLNISTRYLNEQIDPMTDSGRLVKSDTHLYLPHLYRDETFVAEKLKALSRCRSELSVNPNLEGLAEDQKRALRQIAEHCVFILTGAPGTGKSFLIKRILDAFKNSNFALAAPTGKAAKRIFEHTKQEAVTIHRLLKPVMDKVTGKFVFSRCKSNPIRADLIVIDEVSMIDISLMAKLLDAIKPGSRIILIGDTNQLPSVGPGNVLKDLIASGLFPCEELTEIKRQNEGLIIRNCHRIRDGKMLAFSNDKEDDFFFLRHNSESDIQDRLFDVVTKDIPRKYGADPLKDVQIITGTREKTKLSCKELNGRLQKALAEGPKVAPTIIFRHGDKVIQTKNDYDLGIINGDVGYVQEIDTRTQKIVVDFESPDRKIRLPLYNNELNLAYAVTVHKYQGSEAPYIVIPIYRGFGRFLMQRNWIYTAISRAQKVCILVGQEEEARKAIGRKDQQRRYSKLKARLLEAPDAF